MVVGSMSGAYGDGAHEQVDRDAPVDRAQPLARAPVRSPGRRAGRPPATPRSTRRSGGGRPRRAGRRGARHLPPACRRAGWSRSTRDRRPSAHGRRQRGDGERGRVAHARPRRVGPGRGHRGGVTVAPAGQPGAGPATRASAPAPRRDAGPRPRGERGPVLERVPPLSARRPAGGEQRGLDRRWCPTRTAGRPAARRRPIPSRGARRPPASRAAAPAPVEAPARAGAVARRSCRR